MLRRAQHERLSPVSKPTDCGIYPPVGWQYLTMYSRQGPTNRLSHLAASDLTDINEGLFDESLISRLLGLLTYAEYLSPAHWADTLSRRAFVLHDDSPGTLDLNLFSAFHAICLHLNLLASKICC